MILTQAARAFAHIHTNYVIKIRENESRQSFGEAVGGYFCYRDIDNVELFYRDGLGNSVKPHINVFSAPVKFKII